MFIPPYLQRYLFLNAIRLLTIISCSLVIASTIRLLVINFQHYPPQPATLLDPTLAYYPSTDIPTTFFGVFWSTLHHISISLVLFVVILSELSLPIPLLHRLFKNTLPFLGPNWGTGFSGVLLALVAGDGLSRGSVGGKFKEVSEWCMAVVGVLNVGSGVVWRAKGKTVRGWGGWKVEVAEKLEGLAEAKARAEKVVDGLPMPVGFGKKKAGVEGAGEGGGLKGLVGKATEMMGKKLDERQQKEAKVAAGQPKAIGEKDLEKAQFTNIQPPPAAAAARPPQGLGLFTPALPSAVIQSRSVHPSPRTSLSSTSTDSMAQHHPAPKSVSTRIPPPPLVLHRPPSTATTLSRSSCYSLHPPPPELTNAAFSSPHNHSTMDSHHTNLSPIPPAPTRTPTIKTVRFQSPTPRHLSTTIDSHCADVRGAAEGGKADAGSSFADSKGSANEGATTDVKGSRFLLVPNINTDIGLIEGERSPSVLASLKAAMLEAQAKAMATKKNKSIYLGSGKWFAEYHNAASSPAPGYVSLPGLKINQAEPREETEKGEKGEKEQKKEEEKAGRPYQFL
ncbi:uncharacterized protein UBRO_01292 [Ustilago bromivora]|uniref:Uncharacterized protein n=1 Tax=Ustilago bromivora TaxID=307758 RepID=A0A1K0FYK6_9BASI|nr:uncharacterized protein UBRO_01292 [Ustilago bromivora]SYW74860.1 uncharacterized protein UBRO2_00270 [Ustilago bromivora]